MSGFYGLDVYGGGLYGRTSPVFPVNVPIQVWVWNKNNQFRNMFQAGASPLSGIAFSHSERGCGSFSLQFAEAVSIAKDDRIKIRLFNSDQYFYTGAVRKVPILGSTKRGFEYSGFGFNDYFQRILTGSLSYAADLIETIVIDVVENILVPVTPIAYSVDRIDCPAITITSLTANYSTVGELFDALLKIANSSGVEYMYGVDKDGYFFFRPRLDKVVQILTVGTSGKYSIQSYEPEDSNEARTRIVVLDKDGVYLDTLNSTEDNEIWEEKVTAPDVSNADAVLWAQGILAEKERTTRSASIEWKIEDNFPDVVVADGYIRVIGSTPPTQQITVAGTAFGAGLFGSGLFGGGPVSEWKILDDTLAIKEIKYTINGKKATRSIELGLIPARLEDAIVDVDRKLADLKISLGV
jgi:hypothetical protein